ncbi:hypothetical protein K9K85_02010 [Patescibacteria group bacterium]|nr:hypothetical protein [Patescibacteria group bacterium]
MNIFRSSFLIITLSIVFFLGKNCWAQSQKTDLYFFHSPLCSACRQTEISLGQLKAKYPHLEIKRFNVLSSIHNQEIYKLLSQAYQVKFDSVPGIFIEEKAFNKFSLGVISQIEQILIRCAHQKCPSPNEKLLNQSNKKEEKESSSLNIKITYWLIPFILFFFILKRKKNISSQSSS